MMEVGKSNPDVVGWMVSDNIIILSTMRMEKENMNVIGWIIKNQEINLDILIIVWKYITDVYGRRVS